MTAAANLSRVTTTYPRCETSSQPGFNRPALADVQTRRPSRHADGRPGRKLIPTRRVLEAVLWFLNTGAQWHTLPQSYPNYKTVHRRFQTWCRDEILRRLLPRDRG